MAKQEEMPNIYVSVCGTINMSSAMITTKEKFEKIWKGKTKGKDVSKLFQDAKKWREKFA